MNGGAHNCVGCNQQFCLFILRHPQRCEGKKKQTKMSVIKEPKGMVNDAVVEGNRNQWQQ